MTTEYIIADATVKFINATNPLNESLYYVDGEYWSKDFNKAKKYTESNTVIEEARKLNAVLPVKVLLLQQEGPQISVGEIKF